MENFIREYPNTIPVETCRKLISTFEENIDDSSESLISGYAKKKSTRNSEAIALSLHPAFKKFKKEINSACLNLYLEYRKSIKSLSIDYMTALLFSECYQIIKYKKNDGYYRHHIDIGTMDVSPRSFSIIIYLNDVDEGGETEFPDWGVKVKAETGKVIIFPPFFTHLHQGMVPINCDKYIIVTWLRYNAL